MNQKYFLVRVFVICLASSIFALLGCRGGNDNSVSASGSSMNAEAQRAAQRYADVEFIKCGDSSYATDGGQIWQLRNMKVVAQPQNREMAELHEEDRKRQGIDWYGDIHFECTSGRIYNFGWMDWPVNVCGYNSVQLVHQKGVWFYGMSETLEHLQKTKRPLSCEKIPQ
jgi:hypothetical protein